MALDKKYQADFIEVLTNAILGCIEYFSDGGEDCLKILFTACCRAGKTRIFAKALKNVQKKIGNIVIVGTTINSMPQQLYDNIKNVYREDGATDMYPMLSRDIGVEGILYHGNFLLTGWPQINKSNNSSGLSNVDLNKKNPVPILRKNRNKSPNVRKKVHFGDVAVRVF